MNHHLRCEIICPPRGGPQPLRDEAAAGHLRDHSLCPPAHCARGDRCTTATLLCLIHGGTVPFPATTAAHTTPVAPPAAQVEKRSWSWVTPGGELTTALSLTALLLENPKSSLTQLKRPLTRILPEAFLRAPTFP